MKATKTAAAVTVIELGDLSDTIDTEADEVMALLQMLHVFCQLEQRDVGDGFLDGTLADAAEGLSILTRELGNRVQSVRDHATQLYELATKGQAS